MAHGVTDETSHGVARHSPPEDLFRVSFDLAIDGMLVTSPSGTCIAVNPSMAELTGYSRDELLGMPFDRVLSSDALSAHPGHTPGSSPARRVIAQGQVLRKDGGHLPVEVRARSLPGERLLVTVRDVSERWQAEEALRRSEARYRALVESQTDMVSRYRSDTILTYVNDAYCRFFGKTRDELLGQSFMFMVAPDFRPMVAAETERLAKDPAALVVGEYLNFDHAGRECWIQWIVHSIVDDDGQVIELQAVGRDVTQLKQTQEALRQANVVVESSPVVLFRWKAQAGWPVDYVSNNVVQLGYEVDELLAGDVPYLSLVHPDDRDRVVLELEAFAAGSAERIQQEYRILTKAGDVRWVDDRTTIRRDEGGRVSHYEGILIDVTERKQAEEERAKLQMQLHQSQKIESLGRLAGGVAHDFNNMLTAILGHAQMAMTKTVVADPLYSDLKGIEQSALRSAAVVRQLLAFARQQTVAPKVLDLNDTVASVLGMLHRLIGEDIHFVWRPGQDLWRVKVDPSQIDQLLANLCVNARDAIAGVGTITIESTNATLDADYCAANPGSRPGRHVMLAVSDSGCGMDAETLEHIFEPFFTTKEIGKSTGLGLATVYGIVKQNSGFIKVYSELGKGTTFKVYLPSARDQVVEQPREVASEVPNGRGEMILLVEDEAPILGIGKAMLLRLGYRVLTAGTPSEALRAAQAERGRIDLLLTDVVMPEMDGRALAALIAAVHPETRCLYASGYTSDVIAHRGILEEGVHLLEKPFTMRDLASKVREALADE